eukprot:970138-Ditylum_brightwellii.AAC.1
MSLIYPWKHRNWVQTSHMMSKSRGSKATMQISKESHTNQRGVTSNVMLSAKKLDDEHYRCDLDNLYMSAKFAKMDLQEEVTSRTGQFAVQGTVKAAILCGDPECDGLVAVSVYDTKPVCFLTTANDSFKWIEKTREVYSKERGKQINIRLLCLNINDEYNNVMGHVDAADLLHSYYRCEHWIRKRKWWWAIFWWSFD